MGASSASLFLLVLALLPLAIVVAVVLRPGTAWHTRTLPADVFRAVLGPAFVTWVFPPWGILASQAAVGWWLRGWPSHSGAYLWPAAAMGLWLGWQAPGWVVTATVSLMLAVGVLQTGLSVAQALDWPVLKVMQGVHGTIGHRTGLGIYLGLLVPLAFVSSWSWGLVGIYAVGLWVARSVVSWACALAGLLWVEPWLWPVVVPLLGIVVMHRFVKWNAGAPKQRLLGDAVKARLNVWTMTWQQSTGRWSPWLIGHGADSFYQDSLRWITKRKMQEVYREAHNDYVEFLYEYGLLGVLALASSVWMLWPALGWRDPWTGTMVGFAVAALGNFPFRVAPLVGIGMLCLIVLTRRLT